MAHSFAFLWLGIILTIIFIGVPINNQAHASAASSAFFSVETVPVAIVAYPEDSKLYLVNHNNSITVLASHTHNVSSWIFLENYEQWPNPDISLAVNTVSGKLYAASASSELIYVIDGKTDQIIKEIPLGQFQSGHSIAVNPDTNTIYVASQNNILYVVDGSIDEIIHEIDIGDHTVMAGHVGWNQPAELALNPNTNLVYATNAGSDLISVINGTNNRIIGNITIASPFAAVVNPNTNKLYVSFQSSEAIKVFDGMSFEEIGTIPDVYAASFNNAGIAINPETNTIYAANSGPSGIDSVVIIDGREDKVMEQVKQDFLVRGMAVNHLTGNLYVSVDGFAAVYVISASGAEQPTRPNGSASTTLEQNVVNADRIVIGMVTDKELLGNTEEVWISVYEWLKNGNDSWHQIILDIDAAPIGSTREIELEIGEEVLLTLKDKDVVNGHFGIYSHDSDKPTKYPMMTRDEVISLVRQSENNTHALNEEEELQELLRNSDSDNCRIMEVTTGSDIAADKFLYCTYQDEEMRFYVPISVTLEKVKQELLGHVSEQYFFEHFNLKRAWDESVVNGHAVPTGQAMEFEYTVGNFTLYYPVHVRLGTEEEDKHSLYLRYVPPREIRNIAIEDESQIEKIIYESSCLPAGTPFVLYDAAAVSHVDRGFSPYINGRGPPDVFDRSGNQIIAAEKRFNVWLETGEIQCTASVTNSDDIDASLGRSHEFILMDASAYLGLEGPEPPVNIEQNNDETGAGEFILPVGIGAAIAGIIAFLALRKRR